MLEVRMHPVEARPRKAISDPIASLAVVFMFTVPFKHRAPASHRWRRLRAHPIQIAAPAKSKQLGIKKRYPGFSDSIRARPGRLLGPVDGNRLQATAFCRAWSDKRCDRRIYRQKRRMTVNESPKFHA